jgi:hypothetical protein
MAAFDISEIGTSECFKYLAGAFMLLFANTLAYYSSKPQITKFILALFSLQCMFPYLIE